MLPYQPSNLLTCTEYVLRVPCISHKSIMLIFNVRNRETNPALMIHWKNIQFYNLHVSSIFVCVSPCVVVLNIGKCVAFKNTEQCTAFITHSHSVVFLTRLRSKSGAESKEICILLTVFRKHSLSLSTWCYIL